MYSWDDGILGEGECGGVGVGEWGLKLDKHAHGGGTFILGDGSEVHGGNPRF